MNHKDYIFPPNYVSLVDKTQKELESSLNLETNPNIMLWESIRNRLIELGLSCITANRLVAFLTYDLFAERLNPYSEEESLIIIENTCQAVFNTFNVLTQKFNYDFAMIIFERNYLNE